MGSLGVGRGPAPAQRTAGSFRSAACYDTADAASAVERQIRARERGRRVKPLLHFYPSPSSPPTKHARNHAQEVWAR